MVCFKNIRKNIATAKKKKKKKNGMETKKSVLTPLK